MQNYFTNSVCLNKSEFYFLGYVDLNFVNVSSFIADSCKLIFKKRFGL